MHRLRKGFYFCLLIGMLLTACSQDRITQEDVDAKVWEDSLKAYEITGDYVLNENFELTDEEEVFLEDYLKWSNEVLLDDKEQYNQDDQELVNEIVTIIHSINIHKDTNNYRAIEQLKDNFEKLEEVFGK